MKVRRRRTRGRAGTMDKKRKEGHLKRKRIDLDLKA